MRGIASMMVVAGHCSGYYATPKLFQDAKNILFNGQGSVVLFFVLSGFVLGRSLRNSPLEWRSVASFYVRRLFRIYPALWTASLLGLAYIVFFHWNFPHPGVSTWLLERFKRERFAPIPIAAALVGALGVLVPPAWTIFNEVLESAILPFTSRLSFDRPRWGVLLALALGLIAVTVGPFTYYGVLLYPVDFQVGVLIAVMFNRGWTSKVRSGWIWPVVLAAGCFALFVVRGLILLADPALPQNDPATHAVELVGSAAIIIAINAGPVAFLRNRVLKDLGDISYSVYLLHFPIMCLAAVGLSHVIARDDLTALESVLLLAVTVAVTVVAATAVYRYIELPCIGWGKGLADTLRRKPALQPTPKLEVG